MIRKSFLPVMLAVVLSLFSGCALVDFPDGDGNGGVFAEDYMVGLFLRIGSINNKTGTLDFFPAESLNDENALAVYHAIRFNDGHKYGTLECAESISETTVAITNGGAEVNGKLEIAASLFYTYELSGKSLQLYEVYQTADYDYYTKDDVTSNGYQLSSFGLSAVTLSQDFAVSLAGSGKKDTATYNGKFTLNISMLDYLTGAKIVEFDAAHNVLKTVEIDFDGESELAYAAAEDCAYIFLEKTYEVMHSGAPGGKQQGEVYTERLMLNKQAQKQYDNLYIPLGNGLTKSLSVALSFNGVNGV